MKAIKVLRHMALGSMVAIENDERGYMKKVSEFLEGDFQLIHEKVEMIRVKDGILTIELKDSEN